MKFKWIGIRNFKSYGDYDTKLNLDYNGILFLVGENGSGKTTFLDAILYAIYGKTSSNVDEIINRTIRKGCKVGFCFEINNDEYKILRFREDKNHGNNIFLFKNEENITLRKINDTQKRILEIIQIPYKTMISSILFSSELYVSFLRSAYSKRLNILENLLSINELEKYQKNIHNSRKPILEELRDLDKEKIKTNTEIDTLDRTIKEYERTIKNKIKEIEEKIEKKKKEKKVIINNTDNKIILEIEKNDKYLEWKKETNEILNNISILEVKKENIDNYLLEIKHLETATKCPTCKQEIKNINKASILEKIEAIKNKIKEIKKQNKKLDKEINNLKKEIKEEPEKSIYDIKKLQKMKLIKDNQDKIISNLDNDIFLLEENKKNIFSNNYFEKNKQKVSRLNKKKNIIEKKYEEKNNEKKHYDIMVGLFSNNDSSIKKNIIEDRIDFFNNKINFYLPIFFEKNIKITFDKNLVETILINGKETSFDTFSSGEKMRIELTIAFSLFSLVRVFFHTPINLLVFDELLDQNLDKSGTEKVLEVIDNLSENSSIIIISHNDSYNESYVNSNKIFIYKNKDGFSKIKDKE